MDGVYSNHRRLNHLLDSVVTEVRRFAEGQIQDIQRLTQIGIALSAEKDLNALLEMIVDEAMRFTHADAGTLYTRDDANKCLQFKILKNLTLETHLGGTSGQPITLPPVPLDVNGRPNHANVSSYAALTGDIVNIGDVYEKTDFDFTGPKKYDAHTGYRSKSMLVIPLRNHENAIIGVLQLLNAKDPRTGEVVAFPEEQVDLVAALASQAAIAMENTQLIQSLKDLFEAFIETIATAIDEKSPYTAGHIARVTELTMMIAEAVNAAAEGPLAKTRFSADELEELRIATWLHDVGKITTPEYVVDKSHKLETIFDRIELVEARFDLIAASLETEMLKEQVAHLSNGADPGALADREARLAAALTELEADRNFIRDCNTARRNLGDADVARLRDIAARTYRYRGEDRPWLTADELENLGVRRGTLTDTEREVIQNHVSVSIKMLQQLPFPAKLARVPEYAGGHHEKLDGTGYPAGLTADALPLQARIMAIADVFEALTARDRPYKDPMRLSRAVAILERMVEANHIDRDVFDLFIGSGIYLRYAEAQLDKDQIDVSERSA